MKRIVIFSFLIILVTNCSLFRKRKKKSASEGGQISGVVGEHLGAKAGTQNSEALNSLYSLTSPVAPSAIRPDPDLFARNLIREFREESGIVAREVGRVEGYRNLLGGASQDFSMPAQETYDATSLLAEIKIAEELCQSLVAPLEWLQPGWKTILPEKADKDRENIIFLVKRLLGKNTDSIDETHIQNLENILDQARQANLSEYAAYIPVCTAVVSDAEFLLL